MPNCSSQNKQHSEFSGCFRPPGVQSVLSQGNKELDLFAKKLPFNNSWLRLMFSLFFVQVRPFRHTGLVLNYSSRFYCTSLFPLKTPTNVSAPGGLDVIFIPLAVGKVMLTHSLWLFPASTQCQGSDKCFTIHYTVTCKAAIPLSTDSTNDWTAGS